jgi:hypothetical protein
MTEADTILNLAGLFILTFSFRLKVDLALANLASQNLSAILLSKKAAIGGVDVSG